MPTSSLYDSVATIHHHHGQHWAATPENFLRHLYEDFDFRKEDVWLISYPRSGTAWSYELLYAVLYEGDIAALQQAQQDGRILKFLPLEVGSAASVRGRLEAWKALPSPRVIPTHLPLRLFPKGVLEQRTPMVYVRRDPRDVAVSFYHFHRSHRLLGFYRGSWDDFFEHFLSGRVIYGSWFEHTRDWQQHAAGLPDEVLTLHYEAMQEDPADPIRRIGAFLGKTLSDRSVAAISGHCSFESMGRNPFTNREGDPVMDFSIARFLRKGVVGDWETCFTPDQRRRFSAEWERLERIDAK